MNEVTTDQNFLRGGLRRLGSDCANKCYHDEKNKTVIDASQNIELDQGLKQEVSFFDCHLKGVLTTDIEVLCS